MNESSGGKPYWEQIMLARRWDRVVDFGSPMSAWTPEMFKECQEGGQHEDRKSSNKVG